MTCVLAAAGLAAAFSISTAFAHGDRGDPPLPKESESDRAPTIAVPTNDLDTAYPSIASGRRRS